MTDPRDLPDESKGVHGDPYGQLTEAEENALESGEQSFARRHGPAIAVVLGALLVGATVFALFLSGDTPQARKVQDFTIVAVVPPPPPPPPPPMQQLSPPEQEMIEQPKMVEPEIKQEAQVEEPKDAPPEASDAPPDGPLGLDQAAEGPGDAFNLAGKPGGRGILGGGGGGSRWGWYATIVQQQIESALRQNPKTRNVILQVQVRLWADRSGRIDRVQLVSSTGDVEVDAAIRSEVLPGIALREPPPSDMPMPIVARITARRSG